MQLQYMAVTGSQQKQRHSGLYIKFNQKTCSNCGDSEEILGLFMCWILQLRDLGYCLGREVKDAGKCNMYSFTVLEGKKQESGPENKGAVYSAVVLK